MKGKYICIAIVFGVMALIALACVVLFILAGVGVIPPAHEVSLTERILRTVIPGVISLGLSVYMTLCSIACFKYNDEDFNDEI